MATQRLDPISLAGLGGMAQSSQPAPIALIRVINDPTRSLPGTVNWLPGTMQIRVGSQPGNVEILLPDPAISRNHCVFGVDAMGTFSVMDTGSSNGTYVGNRRLQKGECVNLTSGQMVWLPSQVVFSTGQMVQENVFALQVFPFNAPSGERRSASEFSLMGATVSPAHQQLPHQSMPQLQQQQPYLSQSMSQLPTNPYQSMPQAQQQQHQPLPQAYQSMQQPPQQHQPSLSQYNSLPAMVAATASSSGDVISQKLDFMVQMDQERQMSENFQRMQDELRRMKEEQAERDAKEKERIMQKEMEEVKEKAKEAQRKAEEAERLREEEKRRAEEAIKRKEEEMRKEKEEERRRQEEERRLQEEDRRRQEEERRCLEREKEELLAVVVSKAQPVVEEVDDDSPPKNVALMARSGQSAMTIAAFNGMGGGDQDWSTLKMTSRSPKLYWTFQSPDCRVDLFKVDIDKLRFQSHIPVKLEAKLLSNGAGLCQFRLKGKKTVAIHQCGVKSNSIADAKCDTKFTRKAEKGQTGRSVGHVVNRPVHMPKITFTFNGGNVIVSELDTSTRLIKISCQGCVVAAVGKRNSYHYTDDWILSLEAPDVNHSLRCAIVIAAALCKLWQADCM